MAVTTHDVVARVDSIHTPTLIVTGTHDRPILAANAAILAAKILTGCVVTLDGIGHMF